MWQLKDSSNQCKWCTTKNLTFTHIVSPFAQFSFIYNVNKDPWGIGTNVSVCQVICLHGSVEYSFETDYLQLKSLKHKLWFIIKLIHVRITITAPVTAKVRNLISWHVSSMYSGFSDNFRTFHLNKSSRNLI